MSHSSPDYLIHITRIERIGSQSIDFDLPDAGIGFSGGKSTVLIGSNGSGKTTLLEALLGIRPDYRVQAKILGANVALFHADRKRFIGVSLQSIDFAEGVSIGDIVRLHSRAFQVPVKQEMISLLGLNEILDSQFSKVSGGQKKRLSLYFALGHDPDVGLLDEPEAGLDHQGMEAFLSLVQARNQAEKATIVASHNPMVLDVSHDLLYLDRGSVQYQGLKSDFISTCLGASVLEIDAAQVSRGSLMDIAQTSREWCFGGGQNDKLILFGSTDEIANVRDKLPEEIEQRTIVRECRYSDVLTWINQRAAS